MFSLVPFLSTILPIIASTLLISVVIINLYLKIRRKFPISVNCWFCNSWTKVPYDDRNSFDCPTCSQYNGFTKDGGYNKIIPEQHDELMNKARRLKTNKSVTNGLCTLCNNNQQLKIFQLANFVPLNEENYDVEIEHFQKQLEKAYKLCKKCDRVLKKTLDKQNAFIFGNRLKNMCTNGIFKMASQIKKETKKSIYVKIDGFLSTALVLAVIFTTLSNIKTFTKILSTNVPAAYLPILRSVISTANTSRVLEINFMAPYFIKSIKMEPYSVICGVGLAFHAVKIIWGRHITATKVNRLLCWVILFLISWVRHGKNYSSYILVVAAFACVYLLTNAFSQEENVAPQKTSGKVMRKLVKNLEYTCSDVTDTSDFENVSSSSKNHSSGDSEYFSKLSTLDVPQHNHYATAGNLLNSSFVSAKSTLPLDLNRSLNNLTLGGLHLKSPRSCPLASLKRPKPVLSPPKFQTANSWVAGGFWGDDGAVMPVGQTTNLSRSSSESSGFGSQHNENAQFLTQKTHFGDFERLSGNSEFTRLSPSPTFPMSPLDGRKNTFYPSQNNVLLVNRVGSPGLIKYNEPYQRFENWSDRINAQATQSFQDLSLHSNCINKTFNL